MTPTGVRLMWTRIGSRDKITPIVVVLAIVPKNDTDAWLSEYGVKSR